MTPNGVMSGMEFTAYFKSLTVPERDDLARKVNSSRGHLQNIAYGYKPCSTELAAALEFESKGKAYCEDLCANETWVRMKDKSWPFRGGRPLVDSGAQHQAETAKA